jgi:hypothetical protein
MNLRDLLICVIRRGGLASILLSNIQLRNITRRRTLTEKGATTRSDLPNRQNTESDCAR